MKREDRWTGQENWKVRLTVVGCAQVASSYPFHPGGRNSGSGYKDKDKDKDRDSDRLHRRHRGMDDEAQLSGRPPY